jgi:hypothetical protein
LVSVVNDGDRRVNLCERDSLPDQIQVSLAVLYDKNLGLLPRSRIRRGA